MRIIGIDEAGRGCVIGPLVMCGVVLDDEEELRTLGVRDSKLISVKKREKLFDELAKLEHHVHQFSAQEINDLMDRGVNLNAIEARGTAAIIDALKPDLVILDCPSVNICAYVSQVRRLLNHREVEIRAEFKADVHFPVVGAASIIAKVTRDAQLRAIERDYDIIVGSGYLTDAVTVAFLEEHFDDFPIFRKHWAPWRKLKEARAQKTLA